MRGEWIEMCNRYMFHFLLLCLSPCGESGLKSQLAPDQPPVVPSLPMRGEWIEITFPAPCEAASSVSPHAGRVD